MPVAVCNTADPTMVAHPPIAWQRRHHHHLASLHRGSDEEAIGPGSRHSVSRLMCGRRCGSEEDGAARPGSRRRRGPHLPHRHHCDTAASTDDAPLSSPSSIAPPCLDLAYAEPGHRHPLVGDHHCCAASLALGSAAAEAVEEQMG